MIVGVLTTCRTQYTSHSSICFFLFNRTTLQVFVTYLTVALYVNPLWFYKHQHDNRVPKLFVACQRWWFQWRFWFVPSVPGYLREDEHKSDPWRKPIEINHMVLHLENELLQPRQSFWITLYKFRSRLHSHVFINYVLPNGFIQIKCEMFSTLLIFLHCHFYCLLDCDILKLWIRYWRFKQTFCLFIVFIDWYMNHLTVFCSYGKNSLR